MCLISVNRKADFEVYEVNEFRVKRYTLRNNFKGNIFSKTSSGFSMLFVRPFWQEVLTLVDVVVRLISINQKEDFEASTFQNPPRSLIYAQLLSRLFANVFASTPVQNSSVGLSTSRLVLGAPRLVPTVRLEHGKSFGITLS